MATVCLAALYLAAGAQAVLAAAETIYTNSRQFDIPFVLDTTTRPEEAPVEVQLHVSTDRGATWQQHGAVNPQTRMFRYLAAQDGAYWFSLRSRDAAGKLHPPRPPEAELVVVVDTVPPAIILDARPAAASTARVNWSIVEQAIAAETIRIEYQSADTSTWTAVELSIDADKPLAALAGEVEVQLPATTAEIRFRALATDRGGNQSSAEVTVPATTPALSPVVGGVQKRNANQADDESLATGSWRDRNATNPRTPIDERAPADIWTAPKPQPATTFTAQRFPRYEPPRAIGAEVLEELPAPLAGSGVSGGRVVEVLPTPPRSSQPPGTESPPTRPVSTPFSTAGNQINTQELPPPPNTDSTNTDTTNSDSAYTDTTYDEYDGGDIDLSDTTADLDLAPRATPRHHQGDGDRLPSFLPGGERPLVVDTQRFEIEYEIETIGPSGVDRVELWGTADGGKTWEVFAIDSDNESPVVLSTDDEGVYGFRILIVDAAGLSGVAPQSGDLPEMWVAVDLTQPDAEISDVEAVPSAGQGEMTVHWQASDMMLAARPVTLSYGETAAGPWSTIAAGLDNTGRFDWQPTADVPDDVFVRLEVRDEAGNIREYVTPQPVHLARMRPKARLRSVRPAS